MPYKVIQGHRGR